MHENQSAPAPPLARKGGLQQKRQKEEQYDGEAKHGIQVGVARLASEMGRGFVNAQKREYPIDLKANPSRGPARLESLVRLSARNRLRWEEEEKAGLHKKGKKQ